MMFENLESRVLMSAVSTVTAQVAEDRLQVKIDLAKFAQDAIEGGQTLIADCKALQADGVQSDPTLAPLLSQLHVDVKAMQTQLKADNLAESEAVSNDMSIICAQKEKILSDTTHAEKLADKAVLVQDQINLQNDMITGLNSRLTTREQDYTTISDDISNLATALQSDTSASPQLVTDMTKFLNDRTTLLGTMEADINTVITDRTALVSALEAELGIL